LRQLGAVWTHVFCSRATAAGNEASRQSPSRASLLSCASRARGGPTPMSRQAAWFHRVGCGSMTRHWRAMSQTGALHAGSLLCHTSDRCKLDASQIRVASHIKVCKSDQRLPSDGACRGRGMRDLGHKWVRGAFGKECAGLEWLECPRAAADVEVALELPSPLRQR